MENNAAFPIDDRLRALINSCDAKSGGNASYVMWHKMSSHDLAQAIFGHPPGGETDKPFCRICSLMRKAKAKCLVIHEHVERERYFHGREQYPAVIDELMHLNIAIPEAYKYVTQITFFSDDSPYINASLPSPKKPEPNNSDHSILASFVIIGLWSPTTDLPNGKREHHYLYESVIEFPTFVVDDNHAQGANDYIYDINTHANSDNANCIRQRVPNNYYHVGDRTIIHVGGNTYILEATYFCQQNMMTSVCAHSAIKMLLWETANIFQPSTSRINAIAAGIRKGRFDPTNGLNIGEIEEICCRYNAKTIILDCENEQNIPPYEFAYSLVESGIPTVVVFASSSNTNGNSSYHVMPVIGHTMNSDEWLPFAVGQYRDMPLLGLHTKRYHEFIPSCEWASHLIIHDDMIGPYMCLGPRTLSTDRIFNSGDDGGRIHFVIGVVPQKNNFPGNPYQAQLLGGRCFSALWNLYMDSIPEAWRKRLESVWYNDDTRWRNVVLRTQIMRSETYTTHLRDSSDYYRTPCALSQYSLKDIKKGLPSRFWMVEFSTPQVFSTNRSKLGEILVSLDAADNRSNLQEDNIERPLLFRMMNHIDMYSKGKFDTGFKSHTRLFSRRETQVEY